MVADTLVHVVRDALGSDAPPADAPEHGRILDAALTQIAAYGVSGTTMEAVAKRAGVGRMTVYRAFAGKGQLLAALVWREARAVTASVAAAAAGAPDIAGRIVEAFVASARVAREHPLVDRLRRFEAESVVELCNHDASQFLDLATGFAAGEIRRAIAVGEIPKVDAAQAAEVLVRLTISFLVLPSSVVDLTNDRAVRDFARSMLVPIVTGIREVPT